jgi:aminomethyltransferase
VSDAEVLRYSPLDAQHRALGARMVPFGGWDMPIQYEGVLEEHRACREHAVVFDVSHLGSLRAVGPGAFDLLQTTLTNDLHRIAVGRAQYTHLLDPDDAHVVDDIIVWWVGDDDFIVMPNASNTERIAGAFGRAADHPGVTIDDITSTRVVLAVQGPQARAKLRSIAPEAASVGRFAVQPFHWDGADGYVAGTGYTGEHGVELHVPVDAAASVWTALLGAGIVPAGLGARDTLRLEAGLPLHGHELGPGITPLQAGLGWVVRFDKGPFRGSVPLAAERDRGPSRRLRGLLLEGRRFPRAGYPVLVDGEPVGEITSGNFSPVLERGIALAFVPPDVSEGAAVEIDIRGTPTPATVVALPFVAATPEHD